MVTSGPGATNTVTPVRDAMADSIPMVIICGQVSRAAIGSDAFQEAPISSVMGSVAKHVFLITNENKLAATLKAAFEVATSGRPGPVVVDIPKDIQTAEISDEDYEEANIGAYANRILAIEESRLSEEKSSEFFDHLTKSKKPLIYFGGGVISANASEELREFVDYFNLPAVSTLMGLGAVVTQHPSSLHMLGMHGTPYANYSVQESDFLIAIGSRFDDRVAGVPDKFAPNAKVIHIDIDAAEFNKLREAHAALRGDINVILPQLELSKDIAPWAHHSESLRSGFKWRYDHPGDLIFAPLLLKQLSDMMPENSIVSTDVGQHQMWAAQHIQPRLPENFITSAGLGTMGFGLPAAMGAAVGRPDDQSVLITGDGSFMMNVQELGTLKRRQIPVKIVLLNNQRLGMVRQWQSLFFDGRHSETILDDNPDFVMLAKAFDIPGKTITRKEEVEPALKEMLESKTSYMLHVLIDEEENVWPLVPPGA